MCVGIFLKLLRSPTTRSRIPLLGAPLVAGPPPPPLLYILRQGAPHEHKLIIDLLAVCGAPSTIIHLGHIVAVLRRSPTSVASSSPSSRCHADGTLPRSSAGSEFVGRYRAERVLNSEVSCVRYLDRSDREDVRLHQPRCANASAFGVRGYVDTLSPLVAMHHHDPDCA